MQELRSKYCRKCKRHTVHGITYDKTVQDALFLLAICSCCTLLPLFLVYAFFTYGRWACSVCGTKSG